MVAYRYGVEPDGNVTNDPHHEFTGRNILFQAHTVEETAHAVRPPVDEVAAALDDAANMLFEARAQAPRPHLDDKILTAWNGLMISAFAQGGGDISTTCGTATPPRARPISSCGACGRRTAAAAAISRRRRRNCGMLDDYAFFAQALLDLYEATFEFRYLAAAIEITGKAEGPVRRCGAGGFFASAHADAERLMRIKDDYDGAEPSGNSVALMNLLRLHRITGSAEFEASARKLIAAFQETASTRFPPACRKCSAPASTISRRRAKSWCAGSRGHEMVAHALEGLRSEPNSACARTPKSRSFSPRWRICIAKNGDNRGLHLRKLRLPRAGAQRGRSGPDC